MGKARGLVVVDVETAGRDPEIFEILEVGWWSFATGERDSFIVPHLLLAFEQEALNVNRYAERRMFDMSQWDNDGWQLRRFASTLPGNLVVGSNPGFDIGFLRKLFRRHDLDLSPFAYPGLDVGTYAAGVLNRQLGERVGLKQLCNILGVQAGSHAAADDVRATGECLIKLQQIAQSRKVA
jgi:DNA polymerase III alpha subunit (gram-positive type)